jgi:hypothetical protein
LWRDRRGMRMSSVGERCQMELATKGSWLRSAVGTE